MTRLSSVRMLAPSLPWRLLMLGLAAWCAGALAVRGQTPTRDGVEEGIPPNPYGTGAGLAILLTNNGFGMGGYYQREIDANTSFLVEASLGAGKDDRELKYFRYGASFVPNKRNYFLMLPIHLGFQQRLFSEHIEDNFRPYLHLSGGPTFGWEYPYFKDENGNNRYDEDIDGRYDIFSAFPRGRGRFGVGATIAVGAYFGFSRRVAQGVRFGYAFNYFFEGIQLLEPDVKNAQTIFHSPVISITFGKLF